MDRRERSAMAGVHGSEQSIAAFITYFAHDDSVGVMAHCGGNKSVWSGGNLTRYISNRLPTSGIGMVNPQLGWLLNYKQPFAQGNMVKQCLHQGGLA